VREWKKNNSLKVKDSKMRERYGITIEDYFSMLGNQNQKCAICLSEDTKRKSTEFFCIDHCHSTGAVRGLLCYQCNIGLGAFSDNEEVLKRAIEYLKGNYENKTNCSN
jgi:ribosomal protein L37AE/L43A